MSFDFSDQNDGGSPLSRRSQRQNNGAVLAIVMVGLAGIATLAVCALGYVVMREKGKSPIPVPQVFLSQADSDYKRTANAYVAEGLVTCKGIDEWVGIPVLRGQVKTTMDAFIHITDAPPHFASIAADLKASREFLVQATHAFDDRDPEYAKKYSKSMRKSLLSAKAKLDRI